MAENTTLVTAAGGNGTAIMILDEPLTRREYEKRGKVLGETWEQYGAEQTGFLITQPGHLHFEMAGGEFCGNASRAAALLFAKFLNRNDVAFTTSGFEGTVTATVKQRDENHYFVRCNFLGMPVDVREITLPDGSAANLVDLGGIVHIVIDGVFPDAPTSYQKIHRDIVDAFELGNREAVGVIWYQRTPEDTVLIHPVVWVNAVDTFFYENSCGSGTIAVSKVTGAASIVQPTGLSITATIGRSVTLESEMEVVR